MSVRDSPGRPGARRHPLRLALFLILASITTGGLLAQTPKRVYIAPDDHTDYFWTADEATYRQAFLDMLDYYLDLADSTAGKAPEYQSRWNCDGSFWVWTYERNRTPAQFQRLIDRIRDGHIGVPLNPLVVFWGATPAEAILRAMYYPGQIERRYGLRFDLAYSMENQTLPLGLSSLWSGAGARYSWKGICACYSQMPDAWDREHDIYWYTGLDGGRVLMKWNSMLLANTSMGGYAEARNPSATVDFVTVGAAQNGFAARYPFDVIGAFGKGWDDLQTLTSEFVTVSEAKTNATRSVRVSNEVDFFRDFEATYAAVPLPSETRSYGNEWDLEFASLAEVSAQAKRSVERLRSAEALATLVSLADPCFMNGREAARDLAWMDLGLFWEHDFGMFDRTGTPITQRIAFQRRLVSEVDAYVNTLQTDAAGALGSMIQTSGTNLRFFAFNPLSWTRTDMADLPYTGPLPVQIFDLATGLETPSQIVSVDGQTWLRILAQDLPSVGYKVFEVRPGSGQAFGDAATVSGNILENAMYRITLADRGAIIGLIDKTRGNREFVRPLAGRAINDLGSGSGTLRVENAGPVSVTLVGEGLTPLNHTSRVTLIRGMPRIDIRDDINQNFSATQTWGFGFNLDAPDVWHEEVGAILRARLTTDGGHYSPRNARYDWLTLNHFADMGGTVSGITLSNADAYFMKLGQSTLSTLDTTTPFLSVLVGGLVIGNSSWGLPGQGGDSHFMDRFALVPRDGYDPAAAMRFALEHQNPPVTGVVTGGAIFPEASYSLLGVSNPDVLLWALKPSEEGIGRGVVTRLWNLSSSASSASVTFAPGPVIGGSTATHIETPLGPLTLSAGQLVDSFTPQQMKTSISQIQRSFPFQDPLLQASLNGEDLVLSWSATGQSCFTAVRSGSPQLSGAVTIYTGPATSITDLTTPEVGSVLYYNVE